MIVRNLNIYGTPLWTPEEKAILDAVLISRSCPVCKARAGKQCIVGRYDAEIDKFVYTNRHRRMENGHVHMGRLPDGFDSIQAVEEAMSNEPKHKRREGAGVRVLEPA